MRIFLILFFATVTFLLFRPILMDVWYPVHDTTAIARAYLLEKTLVAGQIPAIWAAELNGGQGYPLFHFYAPAVTYLSLLGKTITGSYFMGIKLVVVTSSLIGMIGMYLLARKWGRAPGSVAAISYALLPYAAVNLYVRGAYAEYLSMALLPWLFYAWSRIKDARSQIFAAVITTLFILSHNLIPLITLPFLLIWIILSRPANLKLLILPAILTLGLSAFYVLPLLFERDFVQADAIAQTTDYAKHFVAPSQLWNSTWGFGGSDTGVEDGMSFKIGKIQLLLALAATLLILVRRQKKAIFWIVAAMVAAFMTTSYSSLLWQQLPLLRLVQFPWRFLALVGFFVSVLAGYSLTLTKNSHLRLCASGVVIAALLFLNLKLFTPQTTFPADLAKYTNPAYLDTIPSIVPEYRPHWLDTQNPAISNATVLPHLYYPTWEVKLDGEKVASYPNEDGMLTIENPTHTQNIEASQRHTPLENSAILISLITLLIICRIYVKN